MRALICPVLLVAALSACSGSGLSSEMGASTSPISVFELAQEETGVPSNLLIAISQVETGMQMVNGAAEFPGQVPGNGLMGLRDDSVTEGASLSGYTSDEVINERDANVLATAYLMAKWAAEERIDTRDLAAWAPIVGKYSGITDPEALAEYVHHQVYGALNEGVQAEGVMAVPDKLVVPDFPLPTTDVLRDSAAGTVWSPSPNYNSRGGADVDFLIIHTCEGSYSGCWGWLTNPAAGVSSHYVVNEKGTEVRALVDESDRAWHIGASYDCNNNGGEECWRDGTSMNSVSVGIEHAGYASQTSWDPGLIGRSAELACEVTQRQGIPRDSYHIVGHGQLQPWSRSDPGANWPWADYLHQIQDNCGDLSGGTSAGSGTPSGTPSGPGVPVVIDSNNGANDTSSAYVEVSSSWWASASVSGYYNTGYWVAQTDSVSDPASFWFYADSADCYSVEAWWSSAWDRPSNASFMGWNSTDHEVGRTVVNQQVDGGQWNQLGDWTFDAGWNRVLLSRWATPGSYVVADAVRVTPGACSP